MEFANVPTYVNPSTVNASRPFLSWASLKYVLLYGVLASGGFTFVLDVSSEVFLDHRHLSTSALIDKGIQWAVAGIGFGVGSLLRERRSREAQSSGSSEEPR
jgi:hypothetical protein